MTDLVSRLRVDAEWHRSCQRGDMARHADEAADRIEKLEAALRKARHHVQWRSRPILGTSDLVAEIDEALQANQSASEQAP